MQITATLCRLIFAGSILTLSSRVSADRFHLIPDLPNVVFNSTTQGCDLVDIPDAPLRAFKDYKGDVHAFSSHWSNRAFVGPGLEGLKHSCDVVFQSGREPQPNRFNDYEWLTSFFTADGVNVVALVHNELHANESPDLCSSRDYISCWSNSITSASSNDGGYHFTQLRPPANLIASIPYRYRGNIGHPVGYFSPVNIVRLEDYNYMMFYAASLGEQSAGVCVARTLNVNDLQSWRAWDGKAFRVSFINPYLVENKFVGEHVCKPVGKGQIFRPGSLTFDTDRQVFVFASLLRMSDVNRLPGVYTTESADLINWSSAKLMASTSELLEGIMIPQPMILYPSLVDEQSKDRNFGTFSNRGKLMLYYVALSQSSSVRERQLIKKKVILGD